MVAMRRCLFGLGLGFAGCGIVCAVGMPAFADAPRAAESTAGSTAGSTALRARLGDGPQVCPQAIEPLGSFDPALWVANLQPRAGGPRPTPVEEVRWIPLPDDPSRTLGYVECAGNAWHSGFPAPTLRTRFAVYRPQAADPQSSPWVAPTATDTWMLCSGATMQHFDVAQCSFTPAH